MDREAGRLRDAAADLAGTLGQAAREAVTPAQQRAILRLFGVEGLDASGRPLAASTLERCSRGDPARLARGVALPFAVALDEYDLPPLELAREIAGGTIDLELEEELLAEPARRAAAERTVERLVASAEARFEANRTASSELRRLLGEPRRPLLAIDLHDGELPRARVAIKGAVAAGADVVRIHVPTSLELAEARREAGIDPADGPAFGHADGSADRDEKTRPQPDRIVTASGPRPSSASLRAPAGSQRGLAALRSAADEAAAERGSYAWLMTTTPAFGAPEQAVVAGFERLDMVQADPMREIVEDNVDPARALADHAFAHRLQLLAGCRVLIGPGPLVIAADLARGLPATSTAWAGRGLALQALAVEQARGDGLPEDRLLVGATPAWLAADASPVEWLVQAWLRRLVFPGLPIVLAVPPLEGSLRRWPASIVGALAAAGGAFMVLADPADDDVGSAGPGLADASAAARVVAAGLGDGAIHDQAAEAASAILLEATATLELLAGGGWPAILGGGPDTPARLGAAAVVRAAGGFDPLRLPQASPR